MEESKKEPEHTDLEEADCLAEKMIGGIALKTSGWGHRSLPMTGLMTLPPVLIVFFASMVVNFSSLGAQDWPQFRGPGASGLGTGKATVISWNVETGENVLFRTKIPGLAHSSPLVMGDRVYLTTAVTAKKPELKLGLYGSIESIPKEGKQEWRLIALDRKSGAVVFDRLAHQAIPRSQRHPKASQCNSTPASDGQYLVAYFGSEGVFCFNMEGELQWHRDLGKMNAGYFKMPTAQWGFASSPVIHEGKVVVQCDVQEDSFLGVIDLKTGEWDWKKERADVPTWSTPTIAQVGGRTQILVNGWKHTGAYDFESGEEIWKLKGGGDIPVPTPVVGKTMAYFTSAHGMYRPMRAVNLNATGDITPGEVKETNEQIPWVHHRRGNYMQTPILIGDRLFGCSDRGALTCFDAGTGEIHFSERLPGNGFTASPVSDGKHLYVISEPGEVWVVKNSKTYEEVGRFELGDNCMATPAVSDGVIYFRTQNSLLALAKKEGGDPPK